MQYKSQIVDFILYKNGEDGNTPYVHIKYSNDGGATFTTNNGEDPGDYMGVYADFIEADSSDLTKYKWSKIKGEQGIQGLQGLQGPQGEQGIAGQDAAEIVFEYALSSSSTTPPSNYEPGPDIPSTEDKLGTPIIYLTEGDGTWSTTIPERAEEQFIWQRIKLVYVDGTIVIGDPVCLTGDKGEQGIQGIQGESGKTTYFHIKYSAVENPTTSDEMSETPDVYIGTYVDFTETDSTDPGDYTWYRLQGMQGEQGEQGIPGQNGDNGLTSYLHIKYSNDGSTFTDNNGEDVGDYIGQYVDFIEEDSTDPSDYTWSKIKGEQGIQGLQGLQGPQGEQGIAGQDAAEIVFEYALSSSSTTPPSNYEPGPDIPSTEDKLGTPIIYLTEGDGTWSNTVPERGEGQYIWQRIKHIYADGTIVIGDPVCVTGAKGEQGIQGEAGKTTYFHIKYSAVAEPTSSSDMTETPSKYIGTYVDYTETDSTDPADYKWSQFIGDNGEVGPQGEQGIAGQNGENGLTSYLHIKYSNDGGTTFTDNNGETVGDYIGQYVDFTETDSSTPGDYKWSKIKGEQGEQGIQGIQGEKGEDGTGVTILGSYSTEDELTSAHPTGNVGDAYLVAGNLYVWSGSTWENVGNIQGPQGEQGEQGDEGISVVSASIYYQLTDAGEPEKPTTNPPGDEWTTTEPSYEPGTESVLYFVVQTVFSDDTFHYTDVSTVSSFDAVNDLNESVTNVMNVAEAADALATNSATRLDDAESLLQVLNNCISTLITDANGASLMQQTADGGWTFSMGQTEATINDMVELLNELQNSLGSTDATVEKLSGSVTNIEGDLEWINVTTYEDEPCIALGETGSDFKLLITNTRIMFLEGSSVPAYISNKAMNIQKAVIEEELQQGNFVWKIRSNGNMGLVWKG